MRLQEVIYAPMITEKSTVLRDDANIVAFRVAPGANKIEIKKAVQAHYGVKVAEVRVVNNHGKVRRQGRFVGRRPDWKKAYVRLAPGEKGIEFFEGV